MDTLKRRAIYYSVLLVGLLFGYATVYQYGIHTWEAQYDPGRTVSFVEALQFTVETFTATGFGAQSPWQSPLMNVLVMVMDLTGVVVIFGSIPTLIVPLLRQTLSTTVPTSVEGMEDHVVVCTYTPRSDDLLDELRSRDVDYLVVEPDRDTATDLYEDDEPVIRAEPSSVDGLEAADVGAARAVVADVSGGVGTSIVLTAKAIDEDVRVVSVVGQPDRMPYHELAGADVVLSPRELLGRSLAQKIATDVRTDVGEGIELGRDLEIVEMPVARDSALVGSTIAEAGLRERSGVSVIGAWTRGEFQSPPSPDTEIGRSTVLLVSGHREQIAKLSDVAASGLRSVGRGETLVVGMGEVGGMVTRELDEAGVPYTSLDRGDSSHTNDVDVVGDAEDREVLERGGAGEVDSVVLALPDDTVTEFVTLVIRDINPDTEIVARVEEREAVAKMYRAGADYVLALSSVAGRMIASALLEGEQVLSPETQVEVVRTEAPDLVGRTLGEADVRHETDCTVVAVERDGRIETDLGPGFRIEEGDDLVVAGSSDGINRFSERYV